MNAPNYCQLLPAPSSLKISEERGIYSHLCERHLQAIWLEQKYFKPLRTEDGAAVSILSPGIWNSGPGPDFLKAHISIDGQEMRGDIELHLATESWYQHKHHIDPRYNGVVLHISLWPLTKNTRLFTAEAKPLANICLKEHLTIPETRLLQLIDLDLYPYKRFVGSGKCARAVFDKLSVEKCEFFFRSAAKWRLKQKWRQLKAYCFQLEDKESQEAQAVLRAGISMVLGYKNNALPFLTLWQALQNKISKIRSSAKEPEEKELLAYALGLCGFFHPNYEQRWQRSPFYQELKELSSQNISDSFAGPIELKMDRIRPANHPIRRIALLIKMALDDQIAIAFDEMRQLWERKWQAVLENGKWKPLFRKLIGSMPDYAGDPYWQVHYSFEEERQLRKVALFGDDLKKQILFNVFLPWLSALMDERSSSEDEMHAFDAFYAALPSLDAKKATYLAERLFGDCSKKSLMKHADIQQGAYQLHTDFCMHYEASCAGCPFVENYRTVFS